jgi:hypothetical protein
MIVLSGCAFISRPLVDNVFARGEEGFFLHS